MRSKCFTMLLFCLFLFGAAIPVAAAPEAPPFTGVPEQISLHPQPSTRAPAAAGASYLSPPMRTARPFTHMLVRREAIVPSGAALQLAVRASIDGTTWSEWQVLKDNDDLWMTSDGPDVRWSEIVPVGAAAQFWQVRGEFAASPTGEHVELRAVDVNTVDTRLSPEQEAAEREAVARAQNSRAAGTGKPPVVSRSAWGSPDGQGSRAAPAYYPVNHLVVHHTADSNSLYASEPDWSARVRAEWTFHTISRGWGDIGYNYLIDPNGVIYEGRAGGDDVVAFHDTANYGSMGISVIGTYTSATPTQASQQSLVSLMAWKAAQKKIDPLASSYYYGCSISKYCAPKTGTSVIANIAGHRQVTPGHTTCPGDAFMAILPRLRHDVATLLAGGSTTPPDNNDLQVDEFESGFSKSAANWYNTDCGAGGNTFYTFATDQAAESTNSATWRPTIPKSGRYRVYASLPRGCMNRTVDPPTSLTPTAKARYHIHVRPGEDYYVTVNQGAADQWVDLGAYIFEAGTTGAVELSDLTGESLGQGRAIFFDAVKWVPEDAASTDVQLLETRFEGVSAGGRLEVPSGGLLKVSFKVKNTGQATLYTQEPQASLSPNGASFNDASNGVDDAYVYDEGECFLGDGGETYAAFPKESNRFRVVLGPTDESNIRCSGGTSGYPWRWGLNGPLNPGETRTIVGYVRFRNPGTTERTLTLRAGLVQEYVKYYAENVGTTQLVVTPERGKPELSDLGAGMIPQARVYRLGSVPNNFLARTSNPLSIPRGEYVGSFPWTGAMIRWGTGGPFGATGLIDGYVVEQTRAFLAPTSGEYTFRTTSDDGSWLWIDGRLVVSNHGLHDADDPTMGSVNLTAGVHIVSFKYFERSGYATAGYDMRLPGGSDFTLLPDATAGGALALGDLYVQTPTLTLVADDLGGTGVARIRWSWDGATWLDRSGAVLELGKIQNGSYRLRYQAVDMLGQESAVREIAFRVEAGRTLFRAFTPAVTR